MGLGLLVQMMTRLPVQRPALPPLRRWKMTNGLAVPLEATQLKCSPSPRSSGWSTRPCFFRPVKRQLSWRPSGIGRFAQVERLPPQQEAFCLGRRRLHGPLRERSSLLPRVPIMGLPTLMVTRMGERQNVVMDTLVIMDMPWVPLVLRVLESIAASSPTECSCACRGHLDA